MMKSHPVIEFAHPLLGVTKEPPYTWCKNSEIEKALDDGAGVVFFFPPVMTVRNA
jgi:hypothetical protein